MAGSASPSGVSRRCGTKVNGFATVDPVNSGDPFNLCPRFGSQAVLGQLIEASTALLGSPTGLVSGSEGLVGCSDPCEATPAVGVKAGRDGGRVVDLPFHSVALPGTTGCLAGALCKKEQQP